VSNPNTTFFKLDPFFLFFLFFSATAQAKRYNWVELNSNKSLTRVNPDPVLFSLFSSATAQAKRYNWVEFNSNKRVNPLNTNTAFSIPDLFVSFSARLSKRNFATG